MSISIDQKQSLFSLHTANTTYQMMVGPHGILQHVYYGRRVGDFNMSYRDFYSDCAFSPNPYELRMLRDYSLDTRSLEYTGSNIGDFRIPSIRITNSDGSRSADFRCTGFEIIDGKYAIPGMPAA